MGTFLVKKELYEGFVYYVKKKSVGRKNFQKKISFSYVLFGTLGYFLTYHHEENVFQYKKHDMICKKLSVPQKRDYFMRGVKRRLRSQLFGSHVTFYVLFALAHFLKHAF